MPSRIEIIRVGDEKNKIKIKNLRQPERCVSRGNAFISPGFKFVFIFIFNAYIETAVRKRPLHSNSIFMR